MRKLKTFLCCHFNHRKHLLTSFLASSLSLDDIWKWNKKDNFEEQPTLQTHTANIRLKEYSQMYGSLNLLYDCNSKVNFFEGSMFFKLKDLNLCRYKLSQMQGKNYPWKKLSVLQNLLYDMNSGKMSKNSFGAPFRDLPLSTFQNGLFCMSSAAGYECVLHFCNFLNFHIT